MAKESSLLTSKVNLGIPLIDIKCKLKQRILTEWQSHWDDNSTKGKFTHLLISKVSVKWLRPNYIVTQVLTNHVAFSIYFDRFNIKPAP